MSPKLTEAILQLSPKEKDKILLRLIGKDYKLQAKLEFELLGDNLLMLDKRNALLDQVAEHIPCSDEGDTPGWLMMRMRDISGNLREHVRVTKDKFGEVLVNTEIMHTAVIQKKKLLIAMIRRSENCAEYIVKKMHDTLKKADKLHPDHHLEIRKKVNEVLKFLHSYGPAAKFIKDYPLPRVWQEE